MRRVVRSFHRFIQGRLIFPTLASLTHATSLPDKRLLASVT
jgi:hypothetical protein